MSKTTLRAMGAVWLLSAAQMVVGAEPKAIHVVVQVVDAATGKGVPKARAFVTRSDHRGAARLTNTMGKARLKARPNKWKQHTIRVEAVGYVPMEWRVAEDELDKATLRFAMTGAVEYGGFVKNEQGQGIPGVGVYLLLPGGACDPPKEGPRPGIRDYRVKTDANGKWTSKVLPAEIRDLWIRLDHPDYVSDDMYGCTPKPPLGQLRKGTGVMVLKRGVNLTGWVRTADGKPVAGARVRLGKDRHGTHYPTTKSDVEGTFTFKSIAPKQHVLTVEHEAFAPELLTTVVSADSKPVQTTLRPGGTITGRVVDKDGKGINDVWIVSDGWKGYRTVKIETRTDKDGRFTLKGCPKEDIGFGVLKTGYMDRRGHPMHPRSEPYEIVLHPPLVIKGAVVDAETGKPIPEFAAIAGTSWDANGDRMHWERRRAKTCREGRFEMTFTYPRKGHLVRVEAKGYVPGISRIFRDDEGSQTCTLKLEKGTGPEGVVKTLGGKPVAGAEVILATPSQGVYLVNGHNERSREAISVKTDGNGHFSFPPQTDKYALVVVHDKGCAEVTQEQLASSSHVGLEPWGRVEGTLRIGAKPGAQKQIVLFYHRRYDPKAPRIDYRYSTTAGDDGKFVIERVCPGEVSVGRSVRLSERSTGYTHCVRVDVKPGETARLTIGGTGRPVVGRGVLPPGTKQQIDWSCGHHSLSLELPEPNIPGLDKDGDQSREEKQKLYKAWRESEAGKAYERSRRSYAFKVEGDGSFRVEDIPTGKYRLRIQVHEPPPANQCGWGDQIGTASREFDVPEIPGGRSDEPLDLGTLELSILKHLKVGDPAPDFTVKTLDGKPLKLADFRGKVVLLDFWATWCGPCKVETPNLEAAWKRFGKDPRFAMVGLSMDKSPKEPRKYAEKKKLGWTQAFLKDTWSNKVVAAYGVKGIPSIWLIGPDGKVLAKGLRGERIGTEIEAALKKMPKAK